jgi:hypothetical protein
MKLQLTLFFLLLLTTISTLMAGLSFCQPGCMVDPGNSNADMSEMILPGDTKVIAVSANTLQSSALIKSSQAKCK